jgi:plastocyanin
MFLLMVSITTGACSNNSQERTAPARPETPAAGKNADRAVVSGKGPSGAVVTLQPAVAPDPAEASFAQVMDQFGQTFIPEMVVARQGQPVDFRNSEDVLHNVRVDSVETKETVFNVATIPFGNYTHVFDKPGTYRVSCDVHPPMRASIVITDTPYFAVVDNKGTFRIPDVPAGAYTARLSGSGPDQQQEITVEGSSAEVVFGAP